MLHAMTKNPIPAKTGNGTESLKASAMRRIARYWRAIEARTKKELRTRVAAKRARGWVTDGVRLTVTRYNSRTPRLLFSQAMVLPSSLWAISRY